MKSGHSIDDIVDSKLDGCRLDVKTSDRFKFYVQGMCQILDRSFETLQKIQTKIRRKKKGLFKRETKKKKRLR